MADQIMAQDSSLTERIAPERDLSGRILRKLTIGVTWARFLRSGANPQVPELADFVLGNRYFTAIQIRSELAALGAVLAPRCPERALEIGTALGGTLLFLTRLASPDATIVSVDLPGGEFGGGYGRKREWCYRRFARRKQRLHLFRGDSHSSETLARVMSAFKGCEIDYLFIDGDHSYGGVRTDFEMYAPMVREGGLIALHDIVNGAPESVGGVPKFWREIKTHYRHEELIQDPRQGGWGIGLVYVD